MEKKLFIHIGHGKTGTKSIQCFLSAQSSKKDARFCYPVTTQLQGAHHELFQAGTPDHDTWLNGNWKEGEDKKMCDALLKEISETTHDNIIISSEAGLPAMRARRNQRPIQDKLFKKFNDVFDCKIVYYARNQFEALESHYLQHRAYGLKTISFEKFIENKIAFESYDHNSNIKNYWAQIFGKENILTKVYNRNILKNGDVVQDFLELIGLYDKLWEPTTDINVNYTPEYITKKRGYLMDSLKDSLKASIREKFYKSNVEFAANYLDDDGTKILLEGFNDDQG